MAERAEDGHQTVPRGVVIEVARDEFETAEHAIEQRVIDRIVLCSIDGREESGPKFLSRHLGPRETDERKLLGQQTFLGKVVQTLE